MASDIAASQIEETGDEDYMLLGDLNTAREQEELAVHDPLLQDGAGLVRQDNAMSCTSYWVKKSSNPMLRVSALDHVYLAGFGERAGDIPMVSGSHCAEHRCEQYESTDKASGSSFYDVSDHCPVYFEVTAASDDDA
jgi:endonuclease/exonuclease/phosphatase family metal-dependent hydrolase